MSESLPAPRGSADCTSRTKLRTPRVSVQMVAPRTQKEETLGHIVAEGLPKIQNRSLFITTLFFADDSASNTPNLSTPELFYNCISVIAGCQYSLSALL
jgi:hypothetical protein